MSAVGKEPDPLFKSDRATLVISREKDGKLRVLYHGWAEAKTVYEHQVIEVRAGPQGVEARILDRPVERVTGLEAQYEDEGVEDGDH